MRPIYSRTRFERAAERSPDWSSYHEPTVSRHPRDDLFSAIMNGIVTEQPFSERDREIESSNLDAIFSASGG